MLVATLLCLSKYIFGPNAVHPATVWSEDSSISLHILHPPHSLEFVFGMPAWELLGLKSLRWNLQTRWINFHFRAMPGNLQHPYSLLAPCCIGHVMAFFSIAPLVLQLLCGRNVPERDISCVWKFQRRCFLVCSHDRPVCPDFCVLLLILLYLMYCILFYIGWLNCW